MQVTKKPEVNPVFLENLVPRVQQIFDLYVRLEDVLALNVTFERPSSAIELSDGDRLWVKFVYDESESLFSAIKASKSFAARLVGCRLLFSTLIKYLSATQLQYYIQPVAATKI